jgi:hypothetical protein
MHGETHILWKVCRVEEKNFSAPAQKLASFLHLESDCCTGGHAWSKKFVEEGLLLFKDRHQTAGFTLYNPWQHLHTIAVTASFLSVFAGGMANDSILCLPNEILRLIAC